VQQIFVILPHFHLFPQRFLFAGFALSA